MYLTRQNEHLQLSHVWRNRVNTMIDNAKSVYIQSQLDRNVKNPRKFWRIINNFLDNNPTSLSDINFIDDETGSIIVKGEEANFLNNYFVNISTRLGLNADINHIVNTPVYDVEEPLCLEETILEVDEVKCLARNIDITTASCIGHVSTKICEDVLMILPDKFCKLFNVSLHYSIFPRLWSVGYVNVIPKDGNLNKPGNWRPITQTNVYAKVLENFLHKRLILF